MAKVKGPLMAAEVSGKLGDELVFFNRYGENLVRRYVKTDGGDSKQLRQNQGIFAEANQLSKALTETDRQAWNQMTEGLKMNGHNLFMSRSMARLKEYGEYPFVYDVETELRQVGAGEGLAAGDGSSRSGLFDPGLAGDGHLRLVIYYRAWREFYGGFGLIFGVELAEPDCDFYGADRNSDEELTVGCSRGFAINGRCNQDCGEAEFIGEYFDLAGDQSRQRFQVIAYDSGYRRLWLQFVEAVPGAAGSGRRGDWIDGLDLENFQPLSARYYIDLEEDG